MGGGDLTAIQNGFQLLFKYAMSYPGLFSFSKKMTTRYTNSKYFKGQVIALVNAQARCKGEFLILSFKLVPKSAVTGLITVVSDVDVKGYFPLPGGIYTTITSIGVFYPDGKPVQKLGIIPDVKINQTVKGIRAHRDNYSIKL